MLGFQKTKGNLGSTIFQKMEKVTPADGRNLLVCMCSHHQNCLEARHVPEENHHPMSVRFGCDCMCLSPSLRRRKKQASISMSSFALCHFSSQHFLFASVMRSRGCCCVMHIMGPFRYMVLRIIGYIIRLYSSRDEKNIDRQDRQLL